MPDHPYQRFQRQDLVLRDELAIDRTILANERTLLAYLRGSISLLIAGVTFLHFFDRGILLYVGVLCLPVGIGSGIMGTLRYRRMDKSIRGMRESLDQNADARRQA